jgi:hypothetical protein
MQERKYGMYISGIMKLMGCGIKNGYPAGAYAPPKESRSGKTTGTQSMICGRTGCVPPVSISLMVYMRHHGSLRMARPGVS